MHRQWSYVFLALTHRIDDNPVHWQIYASPGFNELISIKHRMVKKKDAIQTYGLDLTWPMPKLNATPALCSHSSSSGRPRKRYLLAHSMKGCMFRSLWRKKIHISQISYIHQLTSFNLSLSVNMQLSYEYSIFILFAYSLIIKFFLVLNCFKETKYASVLYHSSTPRWAGCHNSRR